MRGQGAEREPLKITSVSLDRATLDLLNHQAEREQRSRSHIIRRAVRAYVTDTEEHDDNPRS